MQINPASSERQKEIVVKYYQLLEIHLQEMKTGKADTALEIKDFAEKLHLHPVHLSNTIKEVTGFSTCDIYETGLLRTAKALLLETNLPISQIAARMTYDPSNFTKFFKAYTGVTPKAFRQSEKKTEVFTIFP